MHANKPLNGVSAIESHFTGLIKEKLLEDVDGTAIQFYHFDGKIIISKQTLYVWILK